MRISRFYIEGLQEGVFTPSEEIQHYLTKVLRLKNGRVVEVFDGEDRCARATLEVIDRRHCRLTVEPLKIQSLESTLTTHLALSISKGDRFDWAIQKATELGVSRITPIIAERSEVRNDDKLIEREAHWRKIIIAACEQCGRNRLPQLDRTALLQDVVSQAKADRKMVLHHRGNLGLTADASVTSATVLIGPEGGLSEDEIGFAIDYGFEELTIGPRILRTETAPIVSLSLLQAAWGDF